MRELLIDKILDMNVRHTKMELGGVFGDMQRKLLSIATDEFLLETYAFLVRYDERSKMVGM